MKLNDAIDIKVGNKQVKYVYCGDYFVWGCSIIKYNTNNSVEPDITLFYKPENITKVTSLYDATNNYGEVRFYGSSKITEIPNHLFYECSNIVTVSSGFLPATNLASYCYYSMFHGCSRLNYIKMLATDISASNCLSYWVNSVASSGTFVKNPAMNSLPTGTSGIPSGWTVRNATS